MVFSFEHLEERWFKVGYADVWRTNYIGPAAAVPPDRGWRGALQQAWNSAFRTSAANCASAVINLLLVAAESTRSRVKKLRFHQTNFIREKLPFGVRRPDAALLVFFDRPYGYRKSDSTSIWFTGLKTKANKAASGRRTPKGSFSRMKFV